MTRLRKSAFDTAETKSLRMVYLLAVSALGHTHHVDPMIIHHLANAVLEAYVGSDFPWLPLSTAQIEDMAVLSIDRLLDAHAELFALKH